MMLIVAQCAGIIFLYMTLIFMIAQLKKDNSIVDVAWPIGFIIVALYSLITKGLYSAPHILITCMIIVWGVRLSFHIMVRNWGKGEDPRYKKWRAEWGNTATIRFFFQIFMLQGLILIIIAYPIIVINSSMQQEIGFLHIIGFCMWIIGFFFEAVGDYQLYIFKKNPTNKGNIMMDGLWKYTRHPNYFGEVTMWLGIFIMALSVPYGWTAIISPLLITYLLLFVSGIPMAEKSLEAFPEFQAYKKRTSIFFPLKPKDIK